MGVNNVHIIGNLGADPEMRYTPNGKAVTEFRVAVNTRFGETEETEWFTVICWERLAEVTSEYLEKGREVYVQGRMRTRSWESDGGQKHYKTELIANNVQFIGGGQSEQSDQQRPAREQPPQRPARQPLQRPRGGRATAAKATRSEPFN